MTKLLPPFLLSVRARRKATLLEHDKQRLRRLGRRLLRGRISLAGVVAPVGEVRFYVGNSERERRFVLDRLQKLHLEVAVGPFGPAGLCGGVLCFEHLCPEEVLRRSLGVRVVFFRR